VYGHTIVPQDKKLSNIKILAKKVLCLGEIAKVIHHKAHKMWIIDAYLLTKNNHHFDGYFFLRR